MKNWTGAKDEIGKKKKWVEEGKNTTGQEILQEQTIDILGITDSSGGAAQLLTWGLMAPIYHTGHRWSERGGSALIIVMEFYTESLQACKEVAFKEEMCRVRAGDTHWPHGHMHTAPAFTRQLAHSREGKHVLASCPQAIFIPL